MENNINKEQWINEVMDSTRDMHRAMPPPSLFDKIIGKAQAPQIMTLPIPAIRWAAAAALLIGLNIGSVVYHIGQDRKTAHATSSSANPLATEMQLESTYNY